MSAIRLEASVSSDDLLRAIEKLAPPDLERFASRVFELVAHQRAPSLPGEEADLIQAINKGVPPTTAERYAALVARRSDGTLTPEEHAELLHLGDEIESPRRPESRAPRTVGSAPR